jgi:uroporphyrinogen decarboxylase
MKPYERLLRRLRGKSVDRAPNFNIYMTFAAHYIGQPLSRYYQDYRVLVEANQAMLEHFGVDLYQAISDPYRETADLGAAIEFPEDGLPISKQPLLQAHIDLAKLRLVAPEHGQRMSDRLEAVRLMRQRSIGEYPVMGWVEGALAQASDLRGAGNLMVDLYDQPDWMGELLELCCQVEIEFARAQIQAGADIIGLGDALASQVSTTMYARYALPYEQRIFAAVHEAGALARLHICGNTTRLLPRMVESGADIIDLDWMVNFGQAAAQFGEQVSFCGNFNPVAVMLQGSPEQVYQATVKCLLEGGERCLSAAGCEIPDGTPEANLQAQRRALDSAL